MTDRTDLPTHPRRPVALRPGWMRLATLSLALSVSSAFWWWVLQLLAG
jgi:hypothetical protein